MKKLTSLFCAILLATTFVSASGYWAKSFVTLTSNATLYNYGIINQNWTIDGNWASNNNFNTYDFGTVNSLILNGGYGESGTYGADDFLDASSFVLYYRVYPTTGTGGAWSNIPFSTLFYTNGTRSASTSVNVIYNNLTANVDLIALAGSAAGTFYIETILARTSYWQTTASPYTIANDGGAFTLSVASTGYKATFTKSITTGINKQPVSNLKITTTSGVINASFEGENLVELFTLNGQLIRSMKVTNKFTQSVKNGAYLLRINGVAHKVIVQ